MESMKNEVEKDFLKAIRRPNARVRFILGSGGVEEMLVGNQKFSRKEADPALRGIYGDITNDASDYIEKVEGARKFLGPDKSNYKTRAYIV
jgi:hypothetical protein